MVTRNHLVMVLPGIGGTVLRRPKDNKVVWDAGFADIADLLARPGRMSLAENPRLIPSGLITDKRLVPGWTVIDGYSKLWTALKHLPGADVDPGDVAQGRVEGANIVAFGYDFRRSIADAADALDAEVWRRLDALGWRGEDKRVVIVAHSMGGLVAREWLRRDENWRCCRALITLGTPHRGAPKALEVLVNGVRLLGQRLDRPTDVLSEWPGVFDLLPRYPGVWDSTKGKSYRPCDLAALRLADEAKAAFGRHEAIEKTWNAIPGSGPEMNFRLGFSHPTLSSAVWDGKRLTTEKAAPSWLDVGQWANDLGDGTVPAISAVPIEREHEDSRGRRSVVKHGAIGSLAEVAGIVQEYESRPASLPARGDTRVVALGIDVDEMIPAGNPYPMTVRVHGVPDDAAAAALIKATVRPTDDSGDAGHAAAPSRVTLEWDGARSAFAGQLPTLSPGMYEVTVRARAVPGGGDLECTDSVAVVDADHVA